MKFKTGDVVIKKTGGNKMVVREQTDDKVKCVWFVGSDFCNGEFNEEDLVILEQYHRILIMERRSDLIGKLID